MPDFPKDSVGSSTPFVPSERSLRLRRARVLAMLAIVMLALLGGVPTRGTPRAVAFAAEPAPTPEPSPDAEAERIFARAKETWRARTEAKFASWAVLVRYRKGPKTWDNWWQASYRDSDQRLALHRIVIFDDDKKRLKGVPIELFGVKILDTNPDAELLRVDDPYISPASSFGVLARRGESAPSLEKGDDGLPPPTRESGPRGLAATPSPAPTATPEPLSTPLAEIGHVEATARDYHIELIDTEHLRYGDAYHLAFEPLHDPYVNRLRDVWVKTDTYETLQISMQGLFTGKPYDGARWTVSYVPLDGRFYIAQIRSDESMRFGLTTVDEFEFDFVDYHFPAEIPNYTFEKEF